MIGYAYYFLHCIFLSTMLKSHSSLALKSLKKKKKKDSRRRCNKLLVVSFDFSVILKMFFNDEILNY